MESDQRAGKDVCGEGFEPLFHRMWMGTRDLCLTNPEIKADSSALK